MTTSPRFRNGVTSVSRSAPSFGGSEDSSGNVVPSITSPTAVTTISSLLEACTELFATGEGEGFGARVDVGCELIGSFCGIGATGFWDVDCVCGDVCLKKCSPGNAAYAEWEMQNRLNQATQARNNGSPARTGVPGAHGFRALRWRKRWV